MRAIEKENKRLKGILPKNKDIVNMQKGNRNGHFVGSFVNVAEQVMPTGIQKFMIIDGQQRMTWIYHNPI